MLTNCKSVKFQIESRVCYCEKIVQLGVDNFYLYIYCHRVWSVDNWWNVSSKINSHLRVGRWVFLEHVLFRERVIVVIVPPSNASTDLAASSLILIYNVLSNQSTAVKNWNTTDKAISSSSGEIETVTCGSQRFNVLSA